MSEYRPGPATGPQTERQTTTHVVVPESTLQQRLLARSAFGALLAAVVVLVVGAGLKSVLLSVLSVVAVAVVVAAGYWFLVTRGLLRWLSLTVAVVTPLIILALIVRAGLFLEVALAVALAVVAVLLGLAALSRDRPDPETPPCYEVAPPARPFIIMNPHSGGGKVGKFDLQARAEQLGAEVTLIQGPGPVDVARLASDAVARGADLLGVAGGDGTQALVAGIAASHDLPFMVISAGTRNHFALDLGLDRDNPARCLDALSDGVEVRIDLGLVNGRTFVNNASFGAYADVVQSPEYRDHKAGTALDMLPDLMSHKRGARLTIHANEAKIPEPQAVLVSNNPYGGTDITGIGRRPRLDTARLGVISVSVDSARQAVGLLRGARQRGLTRMVAEEVIIDCSSGTLPVGVDGEALVMTAPVRCTSVGGALRVRVPRHRPGVPAQRAHLDWPRLRQLTFPAGKR